MRRFESFSHLLPAFLLRLLSYSRFHISLVLESTNKSTMKEINGDGLVNISIPFLTLSTVPLLLYAFLARHLDLGIDNNIIVGCLRTFVQLSILGTILKPIFEQKNVYLVIGYILFMILVAAFEANRRTKYVFEGQFLGVTGALVINVCLVALFAFAIIIRPRPVYSPQYVIPICGMLLGNCINGISLSLNHMSIAMVEQQREIELNLSFGATSSEAVQRLLRESVKVGITPLLNNLAIIGLVSIPGMMTGQILGGSPVMQAARYQMLIMYLITACSLGAILMQVMYVVQRGFDDSHTLLLDKFVKVSKQMSLTSSIWAFMQKNVLVKPFSIRETTPLLSEQHRELYCDAPVSSIQIHPLGKSTVPIEMATFEAHSLTRVFEKDTEYGGKSRSILFRDLSFVAQAGDINIVSGPSGSGKSQLLRILALLNPVTLGGKVSLHGKDMDEFNDKTEWRRQVRYVTQYKIDMPGTSSDFIRRVLRFKSWAKLSITFDDIIKDVNQYLSEWGVTDSLLEKEWTVLSGGEAQRVILAFALASKPKVLLLDESTSALDMKSKLAVEKSIIHFTNAFEAFTLLVSHDQDQAGRLV